MPNLSNQKTLVQLIKQISGQANVLTIPRIYITLTGDLRAALVLSQAIYWSDRSDLENGWFYKTYAEWEAEIGITKRQMGRILRDLAPFITTRVFKRDRAPVVHYLVNIAAVTDAITLLCTGLSPNGIIESDETSHSKVTECNNRLLPDVTIESDETSHSSIKHRLPSEITSETTSSSLPPPQIESLQEEEEFYHVLDQRLQEDLLALGIFPKSLTEIDACGWTRSEIRYQMQRCQQQGRDPAALLLYRARQASKTQREVIGYTNRPSSPMPEPPDDDPGPEEQIDRLILAAWSDAVSQVFSDLPMPERTNWIQTIQPIYLADGCLVLAAHPYAWHHYIEPRLDQLLELLGQLNITDLAQEANVD